ncbi:U3 small nucleolar RNA-interacting protein 2-like isoform X2 [Liolophura sinensis]|uniref:U3 small nucleolar RNA-interacting protein 2-like isoform X2 n=1 Tax=Liolophura sinensis TaxID=3198878 RepID=UPI003158A3F8
MSFFIRNTRGRGRRISKATDRKKSLTKSANLIRKSGGEDEDEQLPAKKLKKIANYDDEIESDSDVDISGEDRLRQTHYTSSEDEAETAQEKKLRLAKQYLADLEADESQRREEDDIGRDIISHRLKQDILEQSGKLHKSVATDYLPPSPADIRVLRGHQLSITCLVISPDNQHIFSGSKDCSIIKWNVMTGKKVHIIPGGRKGTEKKHIGHTAHVLAIAISSDGKYLASGDRNKLIHIWNPETFDLIHSFRGHRDAVSGLVFRKGSHQLFSASHDRSVKIWNLDEMAYVETLFGHQYCITAIDSLSRERAVTCGGRDNSIRIWKVIEESQLVFIGHGGSVDCVSLINENNFISGADDNSLSVWSVMKKKPLICVQNAHSGEPSKPGGASQENWITAVCSLQFTDLVASGSKDGYIKFWKCHNDFRSLDPVFSLPVAGFVNSLQFSSDGSFLVAGVGQEHKLGRWWRMKEAKNSICIVPLKKKGQT